MTDPQQQRGAHALRQSERAARRGDLAEAERWTKVATQAAAAAERLASANVLSEEEDEKMRAELRRRFSRISAFDDDVRTWEVEREMHKKMTEVARRTGCPKPPPLRPHPAGDPANLQEQYKHLLNGPEPDDGADLKR